MNKTHTGAAAGLYEGNAVTLWPDRKNNNLINNPTLHIWAWAHATDRHYQTYVKNYIKYFNA